MSSQYTSSQIDLSLVQPNASDQERMKTLIEVLSAYVEHFHGGALEMVSFDGETLQVRMSGACKGCNLQQVTLHGWIEGTVRPFFPDLREVVAVR
jgi:Fe-S cluster biogenesis protein NfuA